VQSYNRSHPETQIDEGAAQLTLIGGTAIAKAARVRSGALEKHPYPYLLSVTALSDEDINTMARGYLDINCAHCHRDSLTISEPNYAGAAGDSGLTVEFNRDFDLDPGKFGVCKTAVAGGYPADPMGFNQYPRDIIPGHPERSYLLFRMNTKDGRHKMPELGRGSIHTEGVELIKAWIKSLDADATNCGVVL
jgi:hypothetical protein